MDMDMNMMNKDSNDTYKIRSRGYTNLRRNRNSGRRMKEALTGQRNQVVSLISRVSESAFKN